MHLFAENKNWWHFITGFDVIVEVPKSKYKTLYEAQCRAREKVFGK